MLYVAEWLWVPMERNYEPTERYWTPFGFMHMIAYLTGIDALTPTQNGLDGMFGYKFVRPWRTSQSNGYISFVVAYLLVCAISLFMFLGLDIAKARNLPARRRLGAIPLTGVGVIAGLLLSGALFLCFDVLGIWEETTMIPWAYGGGAYFDLWVIAIPRNALLPFAMVVNTAIMVAIIHVLMRRHQRYWRFEAITRALLLASIALIFATWIVTAIKPDNEDTWSYHPRPGADTAFIFACTVLLWAWPARIRLLFRLRKHETACNTQDCFACGYDLRGTLSAGRDVCPDCGAGITSDRRKAMATRAAPQG